MAADRRALCAAEAVVIAGLVIMAFGGEVDLEGGAGLIFQRGPRDLLPELAVSHRRGREIASATRPEPAPRDYFNEHEPPS